MDVQAAIEILRKRFPFPERIDHAREAYVRIAQVVTEKVPNGSTILDFGCGACDKAAVLQLMGYRCLAVDDLGDECHARPGYRSTLERFAADIGVEFKVATRGSTAFPNERFDMVMLHGVIEHLHESPRDLLIDLVEQTREEGYLLITVPNAVNVRKRLSVVCGRSNYFDYAGFYWYPGQWRGHVREYVRRDLELMCEFLGVRIVTLCGVDFMLWKLPSWAVAPYRLGTALADGLKDSWLLLAKKPLGWAPRRQVEPSALEQMLRGTHRDEFGI